MSERSPTKRSSHRRRTLALLGLLGFQSVCALFFLADAVADFFGMEHLLGGVEHHYFEFAVVVALVLGVTFTAFEIHKVLRRQRSMEATVKAASGAFQQLMEDYFDAWALTPSERDVALLAIKGLSIAQIAEVRQTKEGTIKAQCNATYRKAGVTGRPQLLSLFIDELMADGLIEQGPADFSPAEVTSEHSTHRQLPDR